MDQIDELSKPHLEVDPILGENRVRVMICMSPPSYEAHPFLTAIFPILENGGKVMRLMNEYPLCEGFLRSLEFYLRTGRIKNLHKGNSSNANQEILFDLDWER